MGLLLKIVLLIHLFVLINCQSICFPNEECAKPTTRPIEPEIKPRSRKLRSKLRQGCFGKVSRNSIDFYGECRFKRRGCKSEEFSQSRKCGNRLVCCNIPKPVGPTTPRSNIRPTTTPNLFESLNEANCGTSLGSLILGGNDTDEGEFPYMVSFIQKTDGELENFCGGVLITRRHVLSAAHCFDRFPLATWRNSKVIDVRIGLVNIQDTEIRGARAKIKNIYSHEGFKRRTADSINPIHDIAIVTLNRRIQSDKIRTVCLPTAFTQDQNRPDKNSRKLSTLLGWGSNSTSTTDSVDVLQKAFAPVIPVEQCQQKYTDWLGQRYNVNINDGMMCAGDKVVDTCPGDSGSPMLWRDDRSRKAVTGIVSFGPSKCGSGIPGVFTKVENYLQWISNIINKS